MDLLLLPHRVHGAGHHVLHGDGLLLGGRGLLLRPRLLRGRGFRLRGRGRFGGRFPGGLWFLLRRRLGLEGLLLPAKELPLPLLGGLRRLPGHGLRLLHRRRLDGLRLLLRCRRRLDALELLQDVLQSEVPLRRRLPQEQALRVHQIAFRLGGILFVRSLFLFHMRLFSCVSVERGPQRRCRTAS